MPRETASDRRTPAMADPPRNPTPRRSPDRLRTLATAGLLGGTAGLLVALGALVLLRREPLPPLDPDLLAAARRRWEQNRPPDYDLEVRVSGRQPADYRVEVRDGRVVVALRNGRPLRSERTFDTWSVPGMFNTLASDLAHAARWEAGQAEAGVPQLDLRCQFDPQYGYPARYHRTELVRFGANPSVLWEVTRFDPAPAGPARDSGMPGGEPLN